MSVVGPDLPPGAVRTAFDLPTGQPVAAVRLGAAEHRGTVLLVPGFTGSKEDFFPVLPLLADGGWQCIALDQRGQHESPGSDDPAAYTVTALATDLLAVLDLLDGPVHVVGHSFGGLVSRAALLDRPDAFASLTLMSSGPAALSGQRVQAMHAMRPLVATGDLARVADLMDAVTALDTRRPVLPEPLRLFLRHRFLSSSPVGLLAMGDALTSEPDRTDELRAAGRPVLVLHGDLDDAWPPDEQEDMARRLGAAHSVVQGGLHSPAAELPEPTSAALLAFWDGLD